jgi:hypothetical protein
MKSIIEVTHMFDASRPVIYSVVDDTSDDGVDGETYKQSWLGYFHVDLAPAGYELRFKHRLISVGIGCFPAENLAWSAADKLTQEELTEIVRRFE